MQFAIAEKSHEKYLEDTVEEISQDSLWRKRLFEGAYDEPFLITYKELDELPCSLWTVFSQYGLEYFVSKVDSEREKFNKGQIIFKFEAKGFPQLVQYSCNNKNVL
ncbi:hypothetical protein [Pelosinus sp. sgz500959]|uniref:hypothetical protein n=1 Tax=Pelosinus sp. sgz500959 TaxID=3242472 RepID=UPI00366D91B6